MTIKDLIELLEKLPYDYQVGRLGHFGEFYPMKPKDFRIAEVKATFDLSSDYFPITVLAIEPLDIGPEPD